MSHETSQPSLAWHSESSEARHDLVQVVWWRGIRFRLAMTLAVVATLLVGVFGLLAARTVLASSQAQQRETAISQLRAATAAYAFSGELSWNVSLGREQVPNALARVLEPGVLATWDDGHQLWAANQLQDGTVLVSTYPDEPILQRWGSLRTNILQLAAVVAGFASLSGWLLAHGFTRRIRRTATAAGRISDGDLGERALVSGSDEIAVLASAVNAMADDLVRRIEHERALTADAAHELRTPLTALVSATELLGDDPDAARVRRHTTRLRGLVEDVLRLARLENQPGRTEVAEIDLGRLVAEVLADTEGPPPLLAVSPPTLVRADPEGVRRVIENLVANSARHGQHPIRIGVERSALVVEDSGPGYPDELLAQGPRRFRPIGGSGNTGLGLTIVARELAAMGAVLTLANGDHGARTTIQFRS